ncbi:MAG TPA: hypothetical protein VMS21_09005 [Methylomirabilota bacterium]|nr:hypothetical protein [Methylomirabilota bacterium]
MTDLRFAFRQLPKQSGFTTLAVLTPGIGANTAVFSVARTFRLMPMPCDVAVDYPAA